MTAGGNLAPCKSWSSLQSHHSGPGLCEQGTCGEGGSHSPSSRAPRLTGGSRHGLRLAPPILRPPPPSAIICPQNYSSLTGARTLGALKPPKEKK